MQATIRSRNVLPGEFPALTVIPEPPQTLYLAGAVPSDRLIAIVGSRKATAYGLRTAARLASLIAARGGAVVSGLAFGIDACAHRAVLDAQGRSIVVLPTGLSEREISPQSHLGLAREIVARGGALLSEYSPGTPVRKDHYLARNRLISGLAEVVVVVEAALPSGSLITARHATDQNKDVWAVPGPIDSPVSTGTNWLIDQGAHPLRDIEEFLGSLGLSAPASLETEHSEILELFNGDPRQLDTIVMASGLTSAECEVAVTRLELAGHLLHLGGRRYVRLG